jgi:hypothetical protein
VRQLRDVKLRALVETYDTEMLTIYGKTCGWVLARAHAKAGDPWVISGYLGNGDDFDEAMAKLRRHAAVEGGNGEKIVGGTHAAPASLASRAAAALASMSARTANAHIITKSCRKQPRRRCSVGDFDDVVLPVSGSPRTFTQVQHECFQPKSRPRGSTMSMSRNMWLGLLGSLASVMVAPAIACPQWRAGPDW